MKWLILSILGWVFVLQARQAPGNLVVVPSVAMLPTTHGDTDRLVFVKGYRGDNDGGGGSFYHSTGPATTNLGTVFKCLSGGYWIRAFSGEINVKWFGARGDGISDDTAAIRSAVEAGNDPSLGGFVFFPAGRYAISHTISNQGSRLNLRGSGRAFQNGGKPTNGTVLLFTGDNTPILELGGRGDSVSDMSLVYRSLQPTHSTNSDCIRLLDMTLGASLRNISLHNGYRGIHAVHFAFACTLDNICIECASGQFINWVSGEQNSATSLYFQNQQFKNAAIPVAINQLTRNGPELIIPFNPNARPPHLHVNSMLTAHGLGGAPQYLSDGFFVESISSNQLTVRLSSDPKVDPTNSPPGKLPVFYQEFGGMVGPAAYFGGEFAIQALTCELVSMTDKSPLLVSSSSVSIQALHFEFCFWDPEIKSVRPIINYGPSLNISQVKMVSCGFAPEQEVILVTQARAGVTQIDLIKLGAIAHKGAKITLGESRPPGVVSIGPVDGLGTIKANSDGEFDFPGNILRHSFHSENGPISIDRIK